MALVLGVWCTVRQPESHVLVLYKRHFMTYLRHCNHGLCENAYVQGHGGDINVYVCHLAKGRSVKWHLNSFGSRSLCCNFLVVDNCKDQTDKTTPKTKDGQFENSHKLTGNTFIFFILFIDDSSRHWFGVNPLCVQTTVLAAQCLTSKEVHGDRNSATTFLKLYFSLANSICNKKTQSPWYIFQISKDSLLDGP